MLTDLDEVKKRLDEYDSIIERCTKELEERVFHFPRTLKMCLEEHKAAIEGSYNLYISTFGQCQTIPYGEEFKEEKLI